MKTRQLEDSDDRKVCLVLILIPNRVHVNTYSDRDFLFWGRSTEMFVPRVLLLHVSLSRELDHRSTAETSAGKSAKLHHFVSVTGGSSTLFFRDISGTWF